MKFIFLVFSIVSIFSVSSFGAVTCDSDAATVKRDSQSVRVQFRILSDTKLENVEVTLLNPNTGQYNEVIKRAQTSADIQGKKQDRQNHFDVSQDTTDKYELRLPRTVSSLGSFKGFLLVSFEHGRPSLIGLDCQ